MRSIRASVVSIFVLLILSSALGGQNADVPALVDKAMRLLVSPDGSTEQGMSGLASLLDAVTAAAPAARLSSACHTSLARARKLSAGDSSGLEDMASLLGQCYREAHNRPFTMPPTVRSMPDAVAHARGLLSSVRGLVDQGRVDEAVRRMLEVAMLVVTPLDGAPAGRP